MNNSCSLTLTQEAQCELDMDLLCWGSGELGQTGHDKLGDIGPEEAHLRDFTVARLGRVKLLACGSSHSIVVTVDNKIFTWGNGTSGQLGDGERTVRKQPVEIRLPQELIVKGSDVKVSNIVGVACGSRHSFIWTESGQAYSFGNNFYAQLGYDFQRADYKEPQLAPRLFQNLLSSSKISHVACGERHTLFALEDGSVAACGQNDYGQIGIGSNESAVVPRFVECVHHVSKAVCGANHNLVLTGDGRLFQWGCGRACGNVKRNILFPEEVMLPHSPVKDLAGGCWHSLLLTDGGNVFSWGMGQEGQLGLGKDKIHISTPCLLSYSEPITQIQAGDSFSAAVTACGELLLWGQVPFMSRVSDRPGLKRLWTPQPVPLAGRKVCEVACGTWHITALATRSREKNKREEYAHPESETGLRDLIISAPPTECTEKKITVHVLKQVHHMLPQGQGRSEGSDEQDKDEESANAEEEEIKNDRLKKGEGDESLHGTAFATAKSATGMDKRGNDHSSITSDQEDEREGCKAAGPCEPRKQTYRSRGSRDVEFTTLRVLPRPEGEKCRPTGNTFPRLLTEQADSRVVAQTQKERSAHLAEMVKKSGSYSSVSQGSKLKPKPPGKDTDLGAQRVVSRHHSRIRPHTGLESAIYNSSSQLSPGQQVQIPSCSIHPGPQTETPLTPSPSFSEPSGYSPSSYGVPRKNP